jgi:hypothetical protein
MSPPDARRGARNNFSAARQGQSDFYFNQDQTRLGASADHSGSRTTAQVLMNLILNGIEAMKDAPVT